MLHQKPFLPLCLLLLTGVVASAQADTRYHYESLTFRSDFQLKSVLVSSISPDKSGDKSPIIGAAVWADNGKELQCRSYLQFMNMYVPRDVAFDPSLITSAELILYPVDVAGTPEDKEKASRFIVKRVVENWTVDSTKWNHQPAVDSLFGAREILRKKQKNKLISVDVTGLVMDMVRYGNNGFMIANDTTAAKKPLTPWQWFASPWHEEKDMRPLLVIHYKEPLYPALSSIPSAENNDLLRQIDQPIKGAPVNGGPVPEPVKTLPVKE
jgi:hypothetical protein